MHYLVFDATNILFRSFYANKGEDDQTIAGLAHLGALLSINKYFKKYNPDKTILLFDRPNWRKPYTKSHKCISKRIYKNNRRKDQTPADKLKFEAFIEHIHEFEDMIDKHTGIICMSADELEADDLAGGFVEKHANKANTITVVSADGDYIQLLKFTNTTVINPMDGKPRSLKEWDYDPALFMFEKCIRGDTGDNVMSAYPRCRKTKIIKAHNSAIDYTNLMHDTWTHPDGRTIIVKDMMEENRMLMDLTHQPDHIKQIISNTIDQKMNEVNQYSYFHFMKFCGAYGLKKLANQADQFTQLFSH